VHFAKGGFLRAHAALKRDGRCLANDQPVVSRKQVGLLRFAGVS
jgi:hypothetical protein